MIRITYLVAYLLVIAGIALFFFMRDSRQEHRLSGVNCTSNYNIAAKDSEASSVGEVHFLFGDTKVIHAFFLGNVFANGKTYTFTRDIVLRYRVMPDNVTYAIDTMTDEKMHADNTPDDVLKGFLFDKILGVKETLQFKRVNNIILVSDASSPFFSCVIKE
jgi:hypothetical protein